MEVAVKHNSISIHSVVHEVHGKGNVGPVVEIVQLKFEREFLDRKLWPYRLDCLLQFCTRHMRATMRHRMNYHTELDLAAEMQSTMYGHNCSTT